jgi:hypothetical protein
LRNTRSRPLTSSPNKIYTAASSSRSHDVVNTFNIKFTVVEFIELVVLFAFMAVACSRNLLRLKTALPSALCAMLSAFHPLPYALCPLLSTL